MTAALEALFWLSVAGIAYAYAGYPLLLAFLRALPGGNREPSPGAHGRFGEPSVSMLIPVYNEEARIRDKLANVADLDYPPEKLEVIVVSDGSDDGTAAAVEPFVSRNLRFTELAERTGKAEALNHGLNLATREIVVFSDASILLRPDALRRLVRRFADPAVGVVSGEDRIAGGGGEGLYGRLELLVRRLESDVGSIVGASGCFYAQRRSLCRPFPPGQAPDFLSVLSVVGAGYRAVSEPAAVGVMTSLSDPRDEFQRKVRTLIRGMTTLFANRRLLNPARHGLFSFELFSHKLLRWTVPALLAAAFATNAALASRHPYRATMALQVAFYALAAAGAFFRESLGKHAAFRLPLYFTVVNASIVVAWARYLTGTRLEQWNPTRRP